MPYTTIKPATYETKILRSRFIAWLYPASNPEEAREQLNEHCKHYSDATHNCYAYICGINQETSYYSDAGEPGGTAGKPILNAMLRGEITNCLAVVTRYYGGIKLGVKGLIDAYGQTVEQCISKAELVIARQLTRYTITCDYPTYESLKHKIAVFEAKFEKLEYSKDVCFVISFPVIHEAELQEILAGYATQNRLHYS